MGFDFTFDNTIAVFVYISFNAGYRYPVSKNVGFHSVLNYICDAIAEFFSKVTFVIVNVVIIFIFLLNI